jgi:hypothetical protein
MHHRMILAILLAGIVWLTAASDAPAFYRGGYYRGSYGGYARTRTAYNPYSGGYYHSASAYNPYTGRYGTAGAVYNPYTGRYAYGYRRY